jgi:hypothetical protein
MNKDRINWLLRIAVSFALSAAVASAPCFAAESEDEHDPFFSSGPRAAAVGKSESEGNWGRDPFTKPFENGAGAQAAIPGASAISKGLTGIIYGKDVRLAIIAGETVKEGGMVGSQRVSEIREQSIVLVGSDNSAEEVFLDPFSVRSK